MLEELTPKEFESWCQILLERHYRCAVELTPFVGDEGRDLIVHHPGGKILVECKHQPNSSVGRPVVQKLDSAIRKAGAHKGLIITTGRFSKAALQYASELREVGIDFVDGAKLSYIAETVGLSLSTSSRDEKTSLAIKTIPDSDFPGLFMSSVFSEPRFSPGKGCKSPLAVSRSTHYEGYFLADFSAQGKLDTARGRKSASWEGKVWATVDGRAFGVGQPPNSDLGQHQLISLGESLGRTSGSTSPPSIQPHEAKNRMKQFLLDAQAKTVIYTGRNNVTYRRQIQPSANATQISNVCIVYIPRQKFEARTEHVLHIGDVMEVGERFVIRSRSLSECTVCKRPMTADRQIICAECYRPAHIHGFLTPDSFRCSRCKATICRIHTLHIGQKYYCTRCGAGKGQPLPQRWLPHLTIGLVSSATVSAIAILLLLLYWLATNLSPTMDLLTLVLLITAGIITASWMPFLYVVTNWSLGARDMLTYRITSPTPLSANNPEPRQKTWLDGTT